jgi:DNA-binding MarR family transcriptional regulator
MQPLKEPTNQPTHEACARMVLGTFPALMRMFHGAMRKTLGQSHVAGQMRTLGMLRERPWALHDLAEHHHVSPSSMSRTIDALVERGWVMRSSDPDDRRRLLLTLTADGIAMFDAIAEQARITMTELMQPLDEQERSQLLDGLVVLQRLINQNTPNPESEQTHS